MITRSHVLFAVVFTLPALGIAMAGSAPGPRRTEVLGPGLTRQVNAEELASWIIEGRRDFTVVDLRPKERFDGGHVQSAVHCGSCHANKEEGRSMRAEGVIDLSKKLVVYTETGKEPVVLPKLIADSPRLFVVAGGYQSWSRDVLGKVSFDGLKSEDQLGAARKKEAVRAFFSGELPIAPAAKLPIEPIRRKGEHRVTATSEGC